MWIWEHPGSRLLRYTEKRSQIYQNRRPFLLQLTNLLQMLHSREFGYYRNAAGQVQISRVIRPRRCVSTPKGLPLTFYPQLDFGMPTNLCLFSHILKSQTSSTISCWRSTEKQKVIDRHHVFLTTPTYLARKGVNSFSHNPFIQPDSLRLVSQYDLATHTTAIIPMFPQRFSGDNFYRRSYRISSLSKCVLLMFMQISSWRWLHRRRGNSSNNRFSKNSFVLS